jgi:hypothetical protein
MVVFSVLTEGLDEERGATGARVSVSYTQNLPRFHVGSHFTRPPDLISFDELQTDLTIASHPLEAAHNWPDHPISSNIFHYHNPLKQPDFSLAKVRVVSSNLIARSNLSTYEKARDKPRGFAPWGPVAFGGRKASKYPENPLRFHAGSMLVPNTISVTYCEGIF